MAQLTQNFQVSHQWDSHAKHAQIPSNIRLYPKEEQFCPHTLVRNWHTNSARRLPSGETDLVEVMKRVEGWFVNGL